jgi:hypothetical protein
VSSFKKLLVRTSEELLPGNLVCSKHFESVGLVIYVKPPIAYVTPTYFVGVLWSGHYLENVETWHYYEWRIISENS